MEFIRYMFIRDSIYDSDKLTNCDKSNNYNVDKIALEDQMRLTKDLEERRHRADEERKKLEMERVAAELEQKRAMERANIEKEERERMVSFYFLLFNPK